MATPTLSQLSLSGALGPIFIDVRAASRSTPQPAVVVMHGFKGFKDYAFLPAIAERLARSGFTAINISVSGSGVDQDEQFAWPGRFAANTYSREMNDVELVVHAVLRGELGVMPPTSVGMIGHSRGGGVSLCVAREMPAVSALVAWAPISTIRRFTDAEVEVWRKLGTITVENTRTHDILPMNYEIVEDALVNYDRFDIVKAAASLQCPWLLVHGTDDETVPVGEALQLSAAATSPRFESLFIEGTGHTFGARHPWAGAAPHTTQLFDATIKFLSRHLV